MLGKLDTTVLAVQRHVQSTENILTEVLRKISTGKKNEYISDDASAFIVATGIDFNIKALEVGDANMQGAVDLLNTADSYAQAISAALTEMYDLATQASNPLLTATERASLNAGFQAKIDEIDSLATDASYKGTKLLDGTFGTKNIPVGFGSTVKVTLGDFDAIALGIDTLAVDTEAGATAAATALSTLINSTFATRVNEISTSKSIILNTQESQLSLGETLKAAKSRLTEIDLVEETTNLTTMQIIFNAGISALAQANAMRATAGLSLLGSK